MKRHTMLAAVATPLLVLTIALGAQAIASDPSAPSTASDSHVPNDDAAPSTEDAPLPDALVPEVEALDPGTDPNLTPSADPALASANVQITIAATDIVPQAILVSGFVPGVESSGTCTLTLVRDSEIFIVDGTAEPDATTTVCGGLTMSTAGFTPGTWDVTLAYTSDTQTGISSATQVTIR